MSLFKKEKNNLVAREACILEHIRAVLCYVCRYGDYQDKSKRVEECEKYFTEITD